MRSKKRFPRKIILLAIIIILVVGGSLVFYFLQTPGAKGSPYVKEFSTGSSSYPNAIAVDNQGRVWFALWKETALGMLYPSNGTVKTFPLPEPSNTTLETWGVTVDNLNGTVWFTDHISNAIWSFNVTSHEFVQHTVPTSNSFPYELAIDQKGNVWFTEFFGGKLGELAKGGAMKEYTIPGNSPDPAALVIDNGTKWFTEPDGNMIGSFANGSFTMYNTTGYIFSPVGIAIDSSGNFWLTQHTYPGLISEFNPKMHLLRTFATSFNPEFGSSLPYFIYTDPRGDVWFNEHYANSIAVFDPSYMSLIEYHVPLRVKIPGNLSDMLTMTLSPSGEPWFTELATGNIGTINDSASIQPEISVANPTSSFSVSDGSSASISLSVRGGGTLSAYIGNFTQKFSFVFNPQKGNNNFSSILTVQNNGAEPGVYFFTISDESAFLTVSQIVEIVVP